MSNPAKPYLKQSSMNDLWIFGYGSLLWKVNFPFKKKLVGHIEGFARRFWQGGTDHRGIPLAPGRVVTLVKEPEEVVWGVAYLVDSQDVPNVIKYLDHREKGGYSSCRVTFIPRDQCLNHIDLTVYIASPENEEYLGPAPLDDIAKQIAISKGPSGHNFEYLFNLAISVRTLIPHVEDCHLFELEERVKEVLKSQNISSDNFSTLTSA